jgi:hypothetical protein
MMRVPCSEHRVSYEERDLIVETIENVMRRLRVYSLKSHGASIH